MPRAKGLNQTQVLQFQAKFGENILSQKNDISWIEIFLGQFKSPLIYVLLIVGLVSLIMGEYIDASLVLSVLVIDVIMSFYQEYNAQKTLVALRGLLRPRTVVIRDGKKCDIEAKELVPGDIVVLNAGDKVPADGKLIEGVKLLANEAILTGEEEPVYKSIQGNTKLLMGSIVLSGRGLMVVEKIGKLTEMGKIGQSIEEISQKETPLQKRLSDLAKNIAWLVLVICLVIFAIGILRHGDVWSALKISIILSVAAIPASLPIALTIILALGMRRILKRKGLVRKLLSIETLGSTSIICTDKTGTLTEGNMQVVRLEANNTEVCLRALILDNEQKSGLEIALWEYVKKTSAINPQEIYDKYEKIDEEPFDSEKKYSFTINKIEDINTAHLLGAPEKVLSFCNLDKNIEKELLAKIDNWAREGLRLLGVAVKNEGNLYETSDYEWQGLVGIQDPIRAEAKDAIMVAQNAGIKVKIVTGDYRQTAERVALDLGFKILPENVMEGHELEDLTDEELNNRIEKVVLFARVLPHQKLRIVNALQEKGEVVAMMGDGVNDAPALKKSDIGITVGSATEVAKEASDLVLLDSNFKTIIAACEEGRLILSNVKKVVGYVLSNSFAEIILIFGALVLGFTTPITVVQILWVQLVCDGPPDVLLGFETKDKTLMEQTPQEIQREKVLSHSMKYLIFAISTIIGICTLLLFWYFENKTGDIKLAQTISFANIGSVSLIYILSFKNLKKSIFRTDNFFQNKYLFYGIAYGFILMFIAIYVPLFNRLLKTVPLGITHWLLVFSVGVLVIILIEIVKYLENKKNNYVE